MRYAPFCHTLKKSGFVAINKLIGLCFGLSNHLFNHMFHWTYEKYSLKSFWISFGDTYIHNSFHWYFHVTNLSQKYSIPSAYSQSGSLARSDHPARGSVSVYTVDLYRMEVSGFIGTQKKLILLFHDSSAKTTTKRLINCSHNIT